MYKLIKLGQTQLHSKRRINHF